MGEMMGECENEGIEYTESRQHESEWNDAKVIEHLQSEVERLKTSCNLMGVELSRREQEVERLKEDVEQWHSGFNIRSSRMRIAESEVKRLRGELDKFKWNTVDLDPEKFGRFLVKYRTKSGHSAIFIADYDMDDEGNYEWVNMVRGTRITHWMPLPDHIADTSKDEEQNESEGL